MDYYLLGKVAGLPAPVYEDAKEDDDHEEDE